MSDLDRILALPARVPGDATALTARFRVPGGSWSLRQEQADALATITAAGGGLVVLDVGAGKTLTAHLLPELMGAERPLVVAPAKLCAEAARERAIYAEHFRVPVLEYVSYTYISRNPTWLAEYAPDLIICDEAHKFADGKAKRTRAFLDYCRRARPAVVCMSATIADRSLLDWWHLVNLALGDGSPLPTSWSRVAGWAALVDPEPRTEAMPYHRRDLQGMADAHGVTGYRAGLHAQLSRTQGVILSTQGSCDTPLTVTRRAAPHRPALAAAITACQRDLVTPDGEFLPSPMHAASMAQTLALGFYHRWADEVTPEHIEARYIIAEGGDGLDEAVALWAGMEREAVWIDDSVVRELLPDHDCLVWYIHRALADKLAEFGVNVAYAGTRPSEEGLCAASVQAHSAGFNLQGHCANLCLEWFGSPRWMQQLIGRTHRLGQTEAVSVELVGTAHRVHRALDAARFVEQTMGVPQKILQGWKA